ncbi:DUF5659 domain-containing protein [Mesobacillus subterraneus]|uniref:DUF5659 domain-containing protein n=1 Tax=Mesobacillus subterraneus TaxID=285983 RepID=UPI001CFD1DB0|nr:DUF5659 domain-containing protein [Mesobacillus subterraneus]WLR53782.1 DUF5659 domain-containing protein [Mesobacillus subterraneus]
MSVKRIFNKDIAIYLIRMGYEPVDFERHHNNKTIIFLFENTEQLNKDFKACLSF